MAILRYLRDVLFSPHPTAKRRRPTHRPALECLEARDNPSGGLLDTSFNGTGIEALPSSVMYHPIGVAVQPDGKIVSVGDVNTRTGTEAMQVVRMNADGTLDTSFNGTGMATITFGEWAESAALALQPDGKILVGGRGPIAHTGMEYVVARLNANGSLDTTFGNTGRKGVGGGIWAFNASSTATEFLRDLAVLTDSSNHLTGIMVGGQLGGAFEAIKLTPAGGMDTTFGNGGNAVFSVGGVQRVGGMAITPSGGVVMVGAAGLSAEVLALTATGQLDTSFNGTGYRVDNFNGDTAYDDVTVQPTAGGGYRLLVSGDVASSGLVVAYTSGGQLDSTFATGGVFTTSAAVELMKISLAADGSIVVAGYADYTSPDGSGTTLVAVGHLSAAGAVDTTFGTGGTGMSLIPSSDASNPTGLTIDALGRIVLCDDGGLLARLTAP
jgi:uncharacterized delta-60 repeat protein